MYSLISSYLTNAFRKSAKNQTKMEIKQSIHSDILGIVKNENKKYVIVSGKYMVVNKEFETIKAAEEYIAARPIDISFNLILITRHYEKEMEKQVESQN